jgi:hypothetical protein
MCSVAECLEKVADFDELARSTSESRLWRKLDDGTNLKIRGSADTDDAWPML